MDDAHAVMDASRIDVSVLRFVNGTVNFDGENGIEEQLAPFFEPYNEQQPGLVSLRLELTGEITRDESVALQAQLENLGQQWPLLGVKNLVAVPQEDAELAGPENPLQTMIQDALHASDASEEIRAKVIELLPIIIGRCD